MGPSIVLPSQVRPCKDKHSVLLDLFVNYGREKAFSIGSMCQFHKLLFFVTDSVANKLECMYRKVYLKLA
jgi:hypothetical protein